MICSAGAPSAAPEATPPPAKAEPAPEGEKKEESSTDSLFQ